LPNGSANTGIAITDRRFPFSVVRNHQQIVCDGSEQPKGRSFAQEGPPLWRPLSFSAWLHTGLFAVAEPPEPIFNSSQDIA